MWFLSPNIFVFKTDPLVRGWIGSSLCFIYSQSSVATRRICSADKFKEKFNMSDKCKKKFLQWAQFKRQNRRKPDTIFPYKELEESSGYNEYTAGRTSEGSWFDLRQQPELLLFSKTSRPAVVSMQTPVQTAPRTLSWGDKAVGAWKRPSTSN